MADSKLMKLNPHVAGKLAKLVMKDMQNASPGRRIPPPHVGASYLNKDVSSRIATRFMAKSCSQSRRTATTLARATARVVQSRS